MSVVRVTLNDKKIEIGNYKDNLLKIKDLSVLIQGRSIVFPESLIQFLSKEKAKIEAKHKSNGMTYFIDPIDVSMNGEKEDNMYYYPLEFCEIKSTRKGTRVLNCWNGKCVFCVDGVCTKGAIIINSNGECGSFEENPYVKE